MPKKLRFWKLNWLIKKHALQTRANWVLDTYIETECQTVGLPDDFNQLSANTSPNPCDALSDDVGVFYPYEYDSYSGDGFTNDNDYGVTTCDVDLVNIPSSITLNNDNVVQVTFGFTQSDKLYADNPIARSLLHAIIHALNYASNHTNIISIHITATSNGLHGTNSNHYRNRAVDISRINGQMIFDIQNSNEVHYLQLGFDNYTDIRENFGPSFKHKLGANWDVGGHSDHIHVSTNNCN